MTSRGQVQTSMSSLELLGLPDTPGVNSHSHILCRRLPPRRHGQDGYSECPKVVQGCGWWPAALQSRPWTQPSSHTLLQVKQRPETAGADKQKHLSQTLTLTQSRGLLLGLGGGGRREGTGKSLPSQHGETLQSLVSKGSRWGADKFLLLKGKITSLTIRIVLY